MYPAIETDSYSCRNPQSNNPQPQHSGIFELPRSYNQCPQNPSVDVVGGLHDSGNMSTAGGWLGGCPPPAHQRSFSRNASQNQMSVYPNFSSRSERSFSQSAPLMFVSESSQHAHRVPPGSLAPVDYSRGGQYYSQSAVTHSSLSSRDAHLPQESGKHGRFNLFLPCFVMKSIQCIMKGE